LDEGIRSAWRTRLLFLTWTFLGAVIVAAFFIASFFSDFSAIPVGDPGAILLLVPLLVGFLLGVLLTDAEIVVAAGAGVGCAILSSVLVGVYLFSPVLAGVATGSSPLIAFSISRIALSLVVLFPLVVVGSVVGRGVGDLFLPSPRLKRQIEELRQETRQWHEALDRLERQHAEERDLASARPPESREPPERKD
jgi:hypothetical protein